MLSNEFRPWGRFNWVAGKLDQKTWSFLGCFGTEDRFIGAAESVLANNALASNLFIDVRDHGIDFTEDNTAKKIINERLLRRHLGADLNLLEMGLLDSPIILKKLANEFIANSNGSIIIDISCFPKRFFFPLLKILQQSVDVVDLLACYTLPERYHDGDLAENPLPWSHIPMFQRCDVPLPTIEKAIVGVGFLPFGLPSLLKNDYSNAEVTLLFPFPPGPPHYQRTWNFVREIEKFYPLNNRDQILRVDVNDVPGCFEHLKNITNDGNTPSILAPYGPKTHSLAMALFAIKNDCDVFYTQPKQYHPEYSSGIKHINGEPEVYSYCLKLDGNSLY
jgi:hypothetical protein